MSRLVKITPTIDDSWGDIKEGFLLLKRAQKLSERTITDYDYHLRLFFSKYPVVSDYDALEKNILKYFADASGLASGTFNMRRKYLNSFLAWCVEEGIIPANPIRHIRIRKDEGRIRPIPENILKKLLDLPNQRTFVGLRDYCFILLSIDTGIRPSEATALLANDVNIRGLEVFVRSEVAKAGVSRTLPLSRETMAVVSRLLAINQQNWSLGHVFCTYDGRPMTTNAWKKRMSFYSRKLKTPISAYDLRHAFAIMYLRNGGDAFTLQRIMGHSDMEMTKRYLKFSQTDLQDAHAGASPLTTLMGRGKRLRNL